MRGPRSLQLRLAVALGLIVTLLWIAMAAITARQLQHQMDIVFDQALRDTAHRLLPLALRGGRDRRERDHRQRDGRPPETDDLYSYTIFDDRGRPIITSDEADLAVFPTPSAYGFVQTATHRLFYEHGPREDVVIAVAEPLTRRSTVARDITMRLGLPLLVVIPLSLAAIFLVVQRSLGPVRNLRDDLGERSAHNLAPLTDHGLPAELGPIVRGINALLQRLDAAFEAERSFAANAAHELRTPVAGAIAQAQRLRAETTDAKAAMRAADIEATLKRLSSLSEKLMQLARAEGARVRVDAATDMRPILQMMVEDFERLGTPDRIELTLSERPVLSDLDPDAFGILSRNLIENALKHGTPDKVVAVGLAADGVLTVTNSGPNLSPDELARLTTRFARAVTNGEGSGLGLAIVQTIAQRADSALHFRSPASDRADGLEVRVTLPTRGREEP